MANVYIGDSKSLVFPVMSDGYLKLEYDDTNISSSKGNFWKHTDSFTLEAIITPYDVNGNGNGKTSGLDTTNSIKTPPSPNLTDDDHADTTSNYQSVSYFGDGRNTHKMMIFYNQFFRLYLQNTTSHNFNQPAEYKIMVEIYDTALESSVVIPTNTVIKPVNTLYGYYDEFGYYNNLATSLTRLSNDSTLTDPNYSVTNAIYFPTNYSNILEQLAADVSEGGTELFNSNGVSLGKVLTKGAGTSQSYFATIADTSNHTSSIYISQPKEAMYVSSMYKIACTFSSGGTLDIYLNNSLIKTHKFTTEPTFAFHAGDSYIGQDGSNTNTQFMGELYEISLHKGKQPSASLTTLSPSYSNIFFYYTFGE